MPRLPAPRVCGSCYYMESMSWHGDVHWRVINDTHGRLPSRPSQRADNILMSTHKVIRTTMASCTTPNVSRILRQRHVAGHRACRHGLMRSSPLLGYNRCARPFPLIRGYCPYRNSRHMATAISTHDKHIATRQVRVFALVQFTT